MSERADWRERVCRILRYIDAAREPPRIDEIAVSLRVNLRGLSTTCGTILRRGLIERVSGEGRRNGRTAPTYRYAVTSAGRRFLREKGEVRPRERKTQAEVARSSGGELWDVWKEGR